MRAAKILIVISFFLTASISANAQFLMDMIDTSTTLGKGIIGMYQKYDALRFSGYIQPQFQVAQSKGAAGYAGGDFPPAVDNRFTLRRGRLRIDYERFDKNAMPVLQFAFQFDGTEKGVFIRDFFGRFFETKFNVFSLAGGMFARPFGYEVNLASSDRESPERGRMSQILMKTERDLGAMISFEPRRKDHPLKALKIDLGAFNGPGLTSTTDFDSHKDVIGRIGVKPIKISKSGILLSGSTSIFYGGMEQFTNFIYQMGTVNGKPGFVVDSSFSNKGKIAPRHYYGADFQLKIPNGEGKGSTQIRAEYIFGKQTATSFTTETPGVIPVGSDGKLLPLYIRPFDGAYFYFIQNLGSTKHLVVVKYDWYDPNRRVKGTQIGAPDAGLTPADIRYNTLGFGYLYNANEHLKFTLYYDWVKNESTDLPGYTQDLKDNVFTARMQFRF